MVWRISYVARNQDPSLFERCPECEGAWKFTPSSDASEMLTLPLFMLDMNIWMAHSVPAW